jgi:hypothetical protein
VRDRNHCPRQAVVVALLLASMVTINVRENVRDGDQLAEAANRVEVWR